MINWSIRFKNKIWLAAFFAAFIILVYQIFSMLNIVPPVSQEGAAQMATVAINLLIMVGIVLDPTITGLRDSRQAMCYSEPREEDQDGGL